MKALLDANVIYPTVMREMVLGGASAAELRQKSIEDGMLTLRASGIEKLREGSTSVEEVLRETVA